MDIFEDLMEKDLKKRKEKYMIQSDDYYNKIYDGLSDSEKTKISKKEYVEKLKSIDSLLEKDWKTYAKLEKV